MKILFVNKFLYPNGGSETYIFKLGDYLKSLGHEVEYFGMEHEGRCVGNSINEYTSDMDFHGGSKLAKLTYPLKTIRSGEAYEKMLRVLEHFMPDVVHLNNFNYQLTPSVIEAFALFRRTKKPEARLVFTAHDYQLVCPNHMLNNPATGENCEKCLGGHFFNCTKGRCIHGSLAKSLIGTAEARYWNRKRIYNEIDTMICCTQFMKSKMDTNPLFAGKTAAMLNFIDTDSSADADSTDISQESADSRMPSPGKEYVLYFGRFSSEKGIGALVAACRQLPEIDFVFAGSGPMEGEFKNIFNIKNVGFKKGGELVRLIKNAAFSVYPSQWYENCPFSVMESISYGTPVLGARIGGIPELVEDGVTGELFTSGDIDELTDRILSMWSDPEKLKKYRKNCAEARFDTIGEYAQKLLQIYTR